MGREVSWGEMVGEEDEKLMIVRTHISREAFSAEKYSHQGCEEAFSAEKRYSHQGCEEGT